MVNVITWFHILHNRKKNFIAIFNVSGIHHLKVNEIATCQVIEVYLIFIFSFSPAFFSRLIGNKKEQVMATIKNLQIDPVMVEGGRPDGGH